MPCPKFSVITVVRNGEASLSRAIDSVLDQNNREVEYIIVDGNSTDRTVEIIQRYADRIRWISEPDQGIYDAMNKGLKMARGDWALFLGADDELIASLSALGKAMIDTKAVYYGNVVHTSTGDVYDGKFWKYKITRKNICHQAIFYPRHVYTKKNYSTTSGILADWEYNIEVWGKMADFKFLDVIVSRFNDTGVSAGMGASFEAAKLGAIKRSFGQHYYLLKRASSAVKRAFGRIA